MSSMESLKFIQTLLSQSIKQIVPGRPALVLSANNLNIVWPAEIYERAVNWNDAATTEHFNMRGLSHN